MSIHFSTLMLLFVTLNQSTALYSYFQTLNEPGIIIHSISISNSNEIFIVGEDSKIHVYMNKGNNFAKHSTLSDSGYAINVAEITRDGKWILSVHEDVAIVYRLNRETLFY